MFPATIYRQSDNNTKLVITTIGVDKDDDQYNISALAVIPKASSDVNANLETFEGKGKTITEALEKISLNTGKQIGLAHCDCIIMSKDIIQENITIVLDFFIRTANLTTNASILATDNKAKDLVEVSKNSNNLFDLTLKDIVSNEEKSTMLSSITIESFYKSYFSKACTFCIPILSIEKGDDSNNSNSQGGKENSEEEKSQSSSSDSKNTKTIKNEKSIAILQQGKFVRTLTEDENFIYNLLSKNSDNFQVEIENINDEYTTMGLEVYDQISKIGLPLYKIENNKPYVQYEVWLNVMLEEIHSTQNYSYASIDSLQNFLSKSAEKEILKTIEDKRKSTVETMQKEKNDILNLYAKFNAYKHKAWQKYLNSLDDPKDYLENIDIKINIHLSYVI